MNKIKQAIAYLIHKIKTTYYAARFFLSILTLEFPNDQRRMDSRVRNEPLCLRVTGSQPATTSTDRPSEEHSSSGTCSTPREASHTADNTSGIPCCGMFSFFDGDPADRLGYSNSGDSTGVEGSTVGDIQNGEALLTQDGTDRTWDLLGSRDRQAIILDAMRGYQAGFEYHKLFSVRCVMDLCDRAEMQWEQTFDDLVALKQQQKLVLCETYDDYGKKFYGFFWGLR